MVLHEAAQPLASLPNNEPFDRCRFRSPGFDLGSHHRLEVLASLSSEVIARSCQFHVHFRREFQRLSTPGTDLNRPELVDEVVHIDAEQPDMFYVSLRIRRWF